MQYADLSDAVKSCVLAIDAAAELTGLHCADSLLDTTRQANQRASRSTVDIKVRFPDNTGETRIRAQPVFPNSLLHSDIHLSLLASPTKDSSRAEPTHRTGVCEAMDCPMDSPLYYQLDNPLPDYLGLQLYQQPRQIIGLFENEAHLDTLRNSLVSKLHSVFNGDLSCQTDNSRLNLPVYVDSGVAHWRKAKPERIRSLPGICCKLTHPYHRLNVIAKSRLVVCDSVGIATDAIRASVPAVLSIDVPADYAQVQHCITRFIRHGNYQQLLSEQQVALNDILHTRRQNGYVLRYRQTLQALISAHHNQEDPSEVFDKLPEFAAQLQRGDDLILSSQLALDGKPANSTRLKSGWESSRRKLQKFRESPSRFVNDSQNRWLRAAGSRKASE